jgi:hypothetical protein
VRDARNRRERQSESDIRLRSHIRSLHAVEGNHRQGRQRRSTVDLRTCGQTAQDNNVCISRIIDARQATEPKLPVELASVIVLARHHERSTTVFA